MLIKEKKEKKKKGGGLVNIEDILKVQIFLFS